MCRGGFGRGVMPPKAQVCQSETFGRVPVRREHPFYTLSPSAHLSDRPSRSTSSRLAYVSAAPVPLPRLQPPPRCSLASAVRPIHTRRVVLLHHVVPGNQRYFRISQRPAQVGVARVGQIDGSEVAIIADPARETHRACSQ